MTRVQWTDRVCRRLEAAIAKEAPAGIGRSDDAWAMVDEPSRALLDELRRYERDGGDQERAKQLGLDVLAAWRRAAMRWRAQAA